ncbi:MAG: hypothetical protein A3E84_03710 [Gammaproteobacteria bacterium RIFCSPHIGHO2_12_FULL_42_13]|nr:MAG: hypothetical protein A3E84_03710 [Gammaproteobacteria bacterium RIFCSPHIGHO2_12_FULL_42_13]
MESRLTSILQDKGAKIYHTTKDATVYECAKRMKDLGVGALMVLHGEKLIGLISERDIIHKLVSEKREIHDIKVEEIMTQDPLTVLPTTTVAEAMRIVTDKRFRHLPVVEKGKLLGIISIGDLTRWAMLAQANEISSLTDYIHGGPDHSEDK